MNQKKDAGIRTSLCVFAVALISQPAAQTHGIMWIVPPVLAALCYLVLACAESVIGLVCAIVAATSLYLSALAIQYRWDWSLVFEIETLWRIFYCCFLLTLCFFIGKFVLFKKNIANQKEQTRAAKDRHLCSLEQTITPETELLKLAREQAPKLYSHLKETAALAGEAAGSIGADSLLCEAGGWYHEIGRLCGSSENSITEGIRLVENYQFPLVLVELLKQQNLKESSPASREAAIVMLSDTILSSAEYFKSTKKTGWTMEKIIEQTFRVRLEKGYLNQSGLTAKELYLLRSFFLKRLGEEKSHKLS